MYIRTYERARFVCGERTSGKKGSPRRRKKMAVVGREYLRRKCPRNRGFCTGTGVKYETREGSFEHIRSTAKWLYSVSRPSSDLAIFVKFGKLNLRLHFCVYFFCKLFLFCSILRVDNYRRDKKDFKAFTSKLVENKLTVSISRIAKTLKCHNKIYKAPGKRREARRKTRRKRKKEQKELKRNFLPSFILISYPRQLFLCSVWMCRAHSSSSSFYPPIIVTRIAQ